MEKSIVSSENKNKTDGYKSAAVSGSQENTGNDKPNFKLPLPKKDTPSYLKVEKFYKSLFPKQPSSNFTRLVGQKTSFQKVSMSQPAINCTPSNGAVNKKKKRPDSPRPDWPLYIRKYGISKNK